MTREEAIKELEILKEDYWDDDGYGHETKQYDNTMLALDMAIKALEQEPKAKAFDVLRFVADNAGLSTFEAIEKAYNMGASEQEPILDKINEIIEPLRHISIGEMSDIEWDILRVIDKYKAETEDKE